MEREREREREGGGSEQGAVLINSKMMALLFTRFIFTSKFYSPINYKNIQSNQ